MVALYSVFNSIDQFSFCLNLTLNLSATCMESVLYKVVNVRQSHVVFLKFAEDQIRRVSDDN